MSKIQATSFGSLEPILERDGRVISEVAIFHSRGKEHVHDYDELCFVLDGRGYIEVDDGSPHQTVRHEVKRGSFVVIPAGAGHWMDLDDGIMTILLVYPYNEQT